MLSPQERENLAKLSEMGPKARGNMLFRIRKKIETALDDINEILAGLDAMPSKSAQRVVTDEHVAAAFALSEKLAGILDYAPVEEFDGRRYVTRTREIKTTQKDIVTPPAVERIVSTVPATSIDEARNLLVRNHLMRISARIDPKATRIPGEISLWEAVGCRPYDTGPLTDGVNLAERWTASAGKL